MHKLLISAAIAGLITVSGSALAQDAHHDHAARRLLRQHLHQANAHGMLAHEG
jgi:hypothetical protein